MSAEPPTHRTVKPRKRIYEERPLIVVDPDSGFSLIERTGEVLPLEAMTARFRVEPSSVVLIPNASRYLVTLDEVFRLDPLWQYRLTPIMRRVFKANGEMSKYRIATTIVNFFGWQACRETKTRSRFHFPIDPFTFTRQPIGDILPPGDTRLEQLLEWGADIRDWCRTQKIRVATTTGGLAGQLLRDPRFWPDARRKVPKATNARVRPVLPGNYYRLFTDEGVTHQAYYLDMTSAHHTIASTLRFPHPDRLVARGYFHVSDEPGVTVSDGRPWARAGSAAFRKVTEEGHGLLYAHLSVPSLPPTRFPLPYLTVPGQKMAWIFTNELPTLRELGVPVDWITAAWIAFDHDPGINRYAEFALGELVQTTAYRKRWLKPTLLAVYGVLAAPVQKSETGYRQAKRGHDTAYPAGSGMLPVKALTRKEAESPVVNVLYRGMIEAEQRKRSLDLARNLHSYGNHVLAVYADSVFVDSGKPLPLLPPEWRVHDVLDRLQFASSTAFTSVQMTKLPGVGRDTLERVQRIEAIRKLNL